MIIPWLIECQQTPDKLLWNLLLRADYILGYECVLYCTLLHDLLIICFTVYYVMIYLDMTYFLIFCESYHAC